MKKYILLIIMILSVSLYSCKNITISDFTPNDIGNIMSFLLFSDEQESENISHEEPEITSPTVAESTAAVPEETQPPSETAATETTEAFSEPVTEPEITTTDASVQTTESSAGTSQVFVREGAVVTEVRTDTHFEDAPPVFRRVRFPDNLKMSDNLKRAITNLEPFSIKNFGNADFYLMTTDAMLFTPELGGGDVSDMRTYRTRLVQTACRIRINSVQLAPEHLIAYIEQELKAGNYISDILCAPLELQSRLAEKGYLINLKKIPFINIGADYYNQSAIEAAAINNNVYSLVSDALFDPSEIYAMFYNKDLIKKYNLENPMDLYKNNEWTYDNMFAFNRSLTAAAADINGDYALGFNKESSDIINGLFTGSGNDYFVVRENNYPVLNYNNGQSQKFIDALADIFSQPEINFLDSDDERQRDIFEQGSMLFSIAKLDIIPGISQISFDWGILPVPTLDGGGIRSFASKDSLSLSVLKGTPDTERCGIITEALSITSHNIFQETYIREQLMYTLRDVDSVRVLNDILNNITYNQYNMYSTADGIYGATAGVLKDAANRRGEFAELYAAGANRLNDFFSNSAMFFRN